MDDDIKQALETLRAEHDRLLRVNRELHQRTGALGSLDEYRKELARLHAKCAELAREVLAALPPTGLDRIRDLAKQVEREIAVLGQK